jgi:thiosulfate/3-mercaptopyruvate sulfurtransferase
MLLRTAVAIGVLLTPPPVSAQPTPSPAVPLLVSTGWLADHLNDPRLVVLQTSQAPAAQDQIRGARVVPHAALMTMAAGHDLAAPATLIAALEGAGVSNDSHVVIYGEPLPAGWLFFALDYLGHERTSLLDGGLDKWKTERRPVAPVTAPVSRGRFQPRLRTEVKASAETVRGRPRAAVVLDARSDKEYQSGHIPDARLVEWETVYADPKLQVFKSQQEIARLFAAAGATPGTPAITYCQIGLRSSLLYFAARYAGLDARNYVGSWSDWTAKGLPTAR